MKRYLQRRIQRRLSAFLICLSTLLAINPAMAAEAQTPSEEIVARVIGEWEGTIVIDANRAQDVVWRFELSDTGTLVGFMGPASRGVATLPMQSLAVTDSALSFVVDTQGSYSGQFSATGIAGTWNNRGVREAPLDMTRKGDHVLSEAVIASVVGEWEGSIGGSFDVIWRFEVSDSGKLVGFMGPASQGVATLSMSNLVVTDSELSFTINTEGSYSGHVSETGITGTWNDEGVQEVPLDMTRKQ